MNENDAGKLKEKLGILFKNHGRNFGCLNPLCNSNSPIGSHSISRVFLKAIEESGHVNIYDRNIENHKIHVPEPSSKASKFKGFCRNCDNSLFEPFENQSLQLTQEHLFLLSFRSIAKEYHTKRSAIDSYEQDCQIEFRNSPLIKLHLKDEKRRYSHMKKLYDSACIALKEEKFGFLSHQAFIFGGPPIFLASSIMMPNILPSNRRVQPDNWQPFTVNWIPFQENLTCIIGYPIDASIKPRKFCQAFERLNREHTCLAQLLMTLDNIENIVFKPSFLNALTEYEKHYLHKIFFGFIEPQLLLTYPNFEKFDHFRELPRLDNIRKI